MAPSKRFVVNGESRIVNRESVMRDGCGITPTPAGISNRDSKIEIRNALRVAPFLPKELVDFVDVGLERVAHDEEIVAFAGD